MSPQLPIRSLVCPWCAKAFKTTHPLKKFCTRAHAMREAQQRYYQRRRDAKSTGVTHEVLDNSPVTVLR